MNTVITGSHIAELCCHTLISARYWCDGVANGSITVPSDDCRQDRSIRGLIADCSAHLAMHKFPNPGLRVAGAPVDVGEGAWRYASDPRQGNA